MVQERLTAITDAAAGYMPRWRAQELCNNLVLPFEFLEGEGEDLFGCVVEAIERRQRYHGLVTTAAPGEVAATILEAWTSSRRAV